MTRPKEGASFPRLCRPVVLLGRGKDCALFGIKPNPLAEVIRQYNQRIEDMTRPFRKLEKAARSPLLELFSEQRDLGEMTKEELRDEIRRLRRRKEADNACAPSGVTVSQSKKVPQNKRNRYEVTQAQAAAMFGVDERTIRNWENNPDSAPPEYIGRTDRSKLEIQAKLYKVRKTEQGMARIRNRGNYRDFNRNK